MILPGFVGGAYELDSKNVEAQLCVNLYPEMIESGTGKNGQIAYLRGTPGLSTIKEIGNGPIRLLHRDVTGRNFVVSGNQLFLLTPRTNWRLSFIPVSYNVIQTIIQATDINTGTDTITSNAHGYYTGLKLQTSSTGVLPTGLSAATDYWAIVTGANTFKLASSLANALAGTAVDITAVGTGFMSTIPQFASVTDLSYSAVNVSTDTITKTAHGLYTGLKLQAVTTGIITGTLQLLTDYFVIRVDANNFKLATSLSNANAGTAFDITAIDGSTETWAAVLCGANGQDGGSAFTFGTSTGVVKAASMSGEFPEIPGGSNATIFVDSTNTVYLYADLLSPSPGIVPRRIFTSTNTSIISSHIQWVDSYFVVNEVDSNRFWVSDLNSVTIDALSFASSEGSPDKIMGHIVINRDLWMINELTTELYVNTGNADFPFERVQNGFFEVGCVAKYSIAKIGGFGFWLGRTEAGQGAVYSTQGPKPTRISTHAMEQAIKSYADISTAKGFCYEITGHQFYVLSFAEATWTYDVSTGKWHQRAYTNAGVLERQRADVILFEETTGLHLVGDYEDNRVFSYSEEVYDDDGDFISRIRSTPHITNDTKRLFCSALELVMESGVGLPVGQGSDPQVMLQWSDDGGHTWSDELWTSAGGQVGGVGDFSRRVRWRRLGKFRDRVFKFKITDPVKVRLLSAHMEFKQGGT